MRCALDLYQEASFDIFAKDFMFHGKVAALDHDLLCRFPAFFLFMWLYSVVLKCAAVMVSCEYSHLDFVLRPFVSLLLFLM